MTYAVPTQSAEAFPWKAQGVHWHGYLYSPDDTPPRHREQRIALPPHRVLNHPSAVADWVDEVTVEHVDTTIKVATDLGLPHCGVSLADPSSLERGWTANHLAACQGNSLYITFPAPRLPDQPTLARRFSVYVERMDSTTCPHPPGVCAARHAPPPIEGEVPPSEPQCSNPPPAPTSTASPINR